MGDQTRPFVYVLINCFNKRRRDRSGGAPFFSRRCQPDVFFVDDRLDWQQHDAIVFLWPLDIHASRRACRSMVESIRCFDKRRTERSEPLFLRRSYQPDVFLKTTIWIGRRPMMPYYFL